MAYVDGFVLAVPEKNKDAYLKLATEMAALFRDWGATKTVECWGDDVPDGKLTSFPMAVKAEPGETVLFSWIWWPDKATREAGHKKMMESKHMNAPADMPFDGKRMIFGGFEVILES
ncbi:DUF1428 domain-containing protein [Hyphobacterium marinum]|uniref:DUF1428 domain-containing protein n=1 Tax=Hyphobacterium marinum TaxID=3116574 RepID=A0ABU7LVE8_9PROT|nr:DUF1428 domain-containing protein [Hyphobacterium sp. Y6023]MEE2565232.1 DUF1428 domain-containing protein [Hyphobacterium sp. Y6023]